MKTTQNALYLDVIVFLMVTSNVCTVYKLCVAAELESHWAPGGV